MRAPRAPSERVDPEESASNTGDKCQAVDSPRLVDVFKALMEAEASALDAGRHISWRVDSPQNTVKCFPGGEDTARGAQFAGFAANHRSGRQNLHDQGAEARRRHRDRQ